MCYTRVDFSLYSPDHKILFVGAWVLATAYLVRRIKHPNWGRRGLDQTIIGAAKILWGPHTNDPLTDFGLSHDDVDMPVMEGTRSFILRGWHVPPPASGATTKTCVLAVHGGGRDRRAFLRHTPCLHNAGYGVLLFDCREHGLSHWEGRGLSLGTRESRDVHAVVQFLRRDFGYEFIVAMGTSQV